MANTGNARARVAKAVGRTDEAGNAHAVLGSIVRPTTITLPGTGGVLLVWGIHSKAFLAPRPCQYLVLMQLPLLLLLRRPRLRSNEVLKRHLLLQLDRHFL